MKETNSKQTKSERLKQNTQQLREMKNLLWENGQQEHCGKVTGIIKKHNVAFFVDTSQSHLTKCWVFLEVTAVIIKES